MTLKHLLLPTLIVFSCSSYGQRLTANTAVKTGSIVFETKSTGKSSLVVINQKNKLYNKIPKTGQADTYISEKTNKSALLNAFLHTFTDDRVRQLLPENYLLISYYIDTTGKVLEVYFMLKENTQVTAKELEKLENEIKANVSFKMRPEETKGGDFFVISQAPKYKKVLDRTLEWVMCSNQIFTTPQKKGANS